MARLSQKQLDEIAKSRKLENGCENSLGESVVSPKVISEILGEKNTGTYKYKLPSSVFLGTKINSIPYVEHKDFPKIKIYGKFSGERQRKGAPIYILKEIDHILDHVNEGKNKNATLNFLIWVGLQALKGVNDDIMININDSTYADGEIISKYLTEDHD